MRHQCDTRLLDSIIAATLRGGDKDHIRIGSQYHLRIEVALHANLHRTPILHSGQDIFVEEILRSRDTLHHIMGIKDGEVRQLQGRHTNSTLNRHLNLCKSLRYSHLRILNQGKMVFITHIHQSDAIRISHTKASGIFHYYFCQRVCHRRSITTLGCLATLTRTKQGYEHESTDNFLHFTYHLLVSACKDTDFFVLLQTKQHYYANRHRSDPMVRPHLGIVYLLHPTTLLAIARAAKGVL